VESVPDAKAVTTGIRQTNQVKTQAPMLAPAPMPPRSGFVPIYSVPMTGKVAPSPATDVGIQNVPVRAKRMRSSTGPRTKLRHGGRKDGEEDVDEEEESDEAYSPESDYEYSGARGRRRMSPSGREHYDDLPEHDGPEDEDKASKRGRRSTGNVMPGEENAIQADEEMHPMVAGIAPEGNGTESQMAQTEMAQIQALRELIGHRAEDSTAAEIVEGLPLGPSAEFDAVAKTVGIPVINRVGQAIDPNIAQQYFQQAQAMFMHRHAPQAVVPPTPAQDVSTNILPQT